MQVLRDSSLTVQEKGMYGILVALMGRREYCYTSSGQLQQETGLSRASVYRMLSSLDKQGYIRRSYDPIQKKHIIRNTALSHYEQEITTGVSPESNR